MEEINKALGVADKSLERIANETNKGPQHCALIALREAVGLLAAKVEALSAAPAGTP